jgi:undecaprenyl-diphosphatase
LVNALYQADAGLMRFLNLRLQNPLFDNILPLFDERYLWWTPIALAVICLLIFGGKRGAWAALGAILVVILTDQISSGLIKHLVEKSRPCNILPGLHVWWNSGWIYLPDPVDHVYRASLSFPSGHATNTAGQAAWWGWNYPKWAWVGWTLSIVIGYSRIYDGVHWPSDVAAGWILGAGIGLGVTYLAGRWGPKTIRKKTSGSN